VWPAMDRVLLHVLHVHASTKPHEQVLEISPRRPAHGFLLWAGEVGETLDKFPVTFAELVGTRPGPRSLCAACHAVRGAPVAAPLVRDEVGKVVLEEHAGGGGVAPVVHFAAPVDPVHYSSRPKETTVASITLKHQGIAASSALDHGVHVPSRSLARVVCGRHHLSKDGVEAAIKRPREGGGESLDSDNRLRVQRAIICLCH